MEWFDKARSILHRTHGLPLPDPDRLDIGSVSDTALLIQAIDASMPRTAILQLIGPRHKALLPFLAKRSLAMRQSAGEYFVPLETGAVADLAHLVAACVPTEVCSHLFVQDGDETLLEAFSRDRGEDVVWISSRLSRARLRKFLKVIAGSPPVADIPRRLAVAEPVRPQMVLLK